MTTTLFNTKYAYINQNTDPVSGAVTSQSTTIGDFTFRSVVKPASSYRVKPVDLFNGSTPRTTYFTSYASSFGIAVNTPYSRTVGRAFLDYYDSASVLLPVVIPPDFATLRNQIRNELRGTAANLAMALAEYKKTAELFSSSARHVAEAMVPATAGLVDPRSVKKLTPRNVSKTIAKRYLAFQYGVKPLCSDMIASLDELNAAAKAKPLIKMGRKQRVTHGYRTSPLNSRSGNFRPASATVDITYISTIRWQAVMKKDSVGTQLVRHGFANPFSLAYELVPYSFVLDWWINVGEVLASLDNLSLAESLVVIESTRRIQSISVTGSDPNCPGKYKVLDIVDSRGGPTAISLINTLQYKKSSSAVHIANGLALLRASRR